MIKSFIYPQDRKIFNAVWLLAFPVIISNLSRVIMSLVDIAMVGHLGPEALAATGMGGMLAWGALSIVLGIRTSVQTITSRRLGQKRTKECINALINGFILASAYALPISTLGYSYGYLIIPLFIDEALTTPIAISYFSISSIGIFFNALSFIFQGFYTGIEKTKIHLNVTIVSNVINAYLNAGLIYGKQGLANSLGLEKISFFDFSNLWFWADFDGMGVSGAAIGTLISSIWMMLHYFYYLNKQDVVRQSKGFLNTGINIKMLKKQVSLSFPMGIQEMMIAIGYSTFYKIMSIIGIVELATTQLLFTIMHASFMPAMGVGQACATLVGKYMGSKEIEKSEQSIKESLRIAEYIMGTMGLFFVFFSKPILMIFTTDPDIINLGVWGLRLIGFLQFVDAVCFTLFLALTGAGNTLFPALVESSLIWGFMLPVSYYAGVVLNIGFKAPFVAFAVYLFLMAFILSIKVAKGDWKEIEV